MVLKSATTGLYIEFSRIVVGPINSTMLSIYLGFQNSYPLFLSGFSKTSTIFAALFNCLYGEISCAVVGQIKMKCNWTIFLDTNVI